MAASGDEEEAGASPCSPLSDASSSMHFGLCGAHDDEEPSFDSLPLELRLKCLANCNWKTLSRAACASRSTRALVAYLVRSPYWRSHVEEQPAVLVTEFATDEEREAACSKWAEGLTGALCGLGTPDICFVFVSCKSHENLPAMLRALRGRLAACTVLAGVVAPGILGKDTATGITYEIESVPEGADEDEEEGEEGAAPPPPPEPVERMGLAVSVLHLPPGSSVHAAFVEEGLPDPSTLPGAWGLRDGELPQGGSLFPRTWLVFSDRHSHVDGVLAELARRYPRETVCGGMGGGTDGETSMLVGLPGRLPGQPLHAEVTSGTLLLSISGPGVESVPLTARGMECISSRFMVGQVAHNVELEPVGRVCLVQQLQSCMPVVQGLDGLTWLPIGDGFTPTSALVAALQAQGPNVPPRAPLFFGVRPPGDSFKRDDPGEMVMLQMHDPNNLMRTSGYVSVQHPVQPGMLAAYFTPKPELSSEQLRERLAGVVSQVYRGDRTAQQAAEGDQQEQPDQQRGGGGAPQPYRLPARGASDSIHTVLTAEPTPVYGALMLPCVAKGRHYYGRPNVESDMLQAHFPGASICGFFSNGEVGPAPQDELGPVDGQCSRMMGYSTVVCMLKLIPAPPPPADWAR